MRLPQTQDALSELAANSLYGSGIHTHSNVSTGMNGLLLGEVPFDPTAHDISDIDPLSLMSAATGLPHVRLELPNKTLELNVVADYRSSNEHPRIATLKQTLAHQIASSAHEALPHVTDRVYSYSIGNTPPKRCV